MTFVIASISRIISFLSLKTQTFIQVSISHASYFYSAIFTTLPLTSFYLYSAKKCLLPFIFLPLRGFSNPTRPEIETNITMFNNNIEFLPQDLPKADDDDMVTGSALGVAPFKHQDHSSTIYKTIDIEKTEAFNRTKRDIENQRQKSDTHSK